MQFLFVLNDFYRSDSFIDLAYMDSIFTREFSRVIQEFHQLEEVRKCVQDMIIQVELNAKDDVMYAFATRN